jgi:hypothetical protein
VDVPAQLGIELVELDRPRAHPGTAPAAPGRVLERASAVFVVLLAAVVVAAVAIHEARASGMASLDPVPNLTRHTTPR